MMKDLNVTEFRRQCMTLLESLPAEGIVVTRHGRPVARVIPMSAARKGSRVRPPLIIGKGKVGPLCPDTETPYDLILD